VRLIVVVCVKLPEAPWTTIENVPVDAFFVADNVSVLGPVVLLGLKDAMTPRGSPEADKLTLPAKPFCGVSVMVDVTFAPRARLNEFGEAVRTKLGGATTVRETVALCDNAPDFPAIVTVKVPNVAVLLAVTVSVLVFAVLTGLNAAVRPLGKSVAERLTLPLNPFRGVTVIVLVPCAPCATLRLLGETESA